MSTSSPAPAAGSLQGRTALVTGGGTGIGYAIAQCMLDAGANVCISGRRKEVIEEAAQQLGGTDRVVGVVGDVKTPEGRAEMIAGATEAFGQPITALVNNAGQLEKKPALEVSDEDYDSILSTHVKAGFALSRELAPGMLEAGGGSIIFLASMTSYMGLPLVIGYTTAKTAVLGIVRGLTAEWSGQGVRVNAIAPGWISTPMTDKAFDGDPQRKAKVLGRTPMGKMGLPEDIGHAAVFLSSDHAKFITGQCLCVDGGASIGF
ncbi:MAG: glucose 1-dehydrogenase [Planctomycetota bacterium]